MTQAIGIVAFVVALLVSITLHEAGHWWTARRFGMKVSRFFVGFGPTVWSFRRGETEYGVKAVPLGGFAKIEGMTPLEEAEPARTPGAGGDLLGRIEGAAPAGGLGAGEADRAFYKQPAPRRAVVLAAGSVVHFLLAILLIYVVLVTLGTQRPSENRIGAVSGCVPVTFGTSCAPSDPPSPAKRAGLRPGDQIVRLDGTSVTTWADLTRRIREHGPGPVTLVVRRDGQELTLRPDLAAVQRDRVTGRAGTDRVGALGVGQGVEPVHYGPLSAVPQTFVVIGRGLSGIWDTLTNRLGDVGQLFSDRRDPNGLVGVVGAARGSGDLLSRPDEPWSVRIGQFTLLVAGLNLFVGIFNLLPLLPLDGGHLAVLGFEQARDRLRRLRGYRGPLQRVDLMKLMPATYAVVAFMIALSVLILSADIVNPIRLNQ